MNDRAVMERLAADNMGLAYSVANKYRGCGMDMAELESAALFGLAKAALSFDPSKNIPFSSFVYPVIENAIRMDLRKLKRHFGQISLDAERYTAENGKYAVTLLDLLSYEDPELQRVDNSELISSLLSGLTKKQAQAVQLVVCDGLTQEEAAEKMNTYQSNVSRHIKSGLAKIRKKMESEVTK